MKNKQIQNQKSRKGSRTSISTRTPLISFSIFFAFCFRIIFFDTASASASSDKSALYKITGDELGAMKALCAVHPNVASPGDDKPDYRYLGDGYIGKDINGVLYLTTPAHVIFGRRDGEIVRATIGGKVKIVCNDGKDEYFATVFDHGKQKQSENRFSVPEDFAFSKLEKADKNQLDPGFLHEASLPNDPEELKKILARYSPAIISRANAENTQYDPNGMDMNLYRLDPCPNSRDLIEEDLFKYSAINGEFRLGCERLGTRSGGALVLVEKSSGKTLKDVDGVPYVFGFFTRSYDGGDANLLRGPTIDAKTDVVKGRDVIPGGISGGQRLGTKGLR